MAGTKAGGLKASQTNRDRYGKDFYEKIGAKGGRNGHSGGFASNNLCGCNYQPESHKKASCAGYKGGRKSRRGKPNPVRYMDIKPQTS
jgi:hypothetical protein